MNQFNSQFSKQAEEIFAAAREVKVPESVQAFAEDSIARTQDAYSKLTVVSRDAGKAFEQVSHVAQSNAKTIGDKVLTNFSSNTEAAFAAARDMARSKTMPEAMKVQSDFFQAQMAKVGEQTREFFELSNAMTKQTLETMNAAASKTFEQMKS